MILFGVPVLFIIGFTTLPPSPNTSRNFSLASRCLHSHRLMRLEAIQMPPSNAILAPWVAASLWSLWQNINAKSLEKLKRHWLIYQWLNGTTVVICYDVIKMRSHWDNWLLWLLTTLTGFSVMAAKTSIAGRRTILPHPLRMESQSSLRRGNVQVQSHEIKKIGGMICMMMGILGMKPGKNRLYVGTMMMKNWECTVRIMQLAAHQSDITITTSFLLPDHLHGLTHCALLFFIDDPESSPKKNVGQVHP